MTPYDDRDDALEPAPLPMMDLETLRFNEAALTESNRKIFEICMRTVTDHEALKERFALALEACNEYRERLDALTIDLTNAMTLAAEREARIKELEADSRRLDWLLTPHGFYWMEKHPNYTPSRGAIDSAMQKAAP